MIVLVCGSRDWADESTIRRWLAELPAGTIVVHGAARGADTIAGEVARSLGFEVREYPARWDEEGRAAGPLRNQRMLDEERPDAALAFATALRTPAGRLTGTGDMCARAVKAGVRVTIVQTARL